MAKQTMKFINHLNAEFPLTWVRDIIGLGIPPVELTNTRGFRQDGHTIQYAQYQARPFTIAFDIREAGYTAAVAERRAIVAFFGDKQPKTFSYTRGGVAYTLTNVYLAGVFDTGIKENSQFEGALQFIAGDPYFKKAEAASTLTDENAVLEYDLEYPADGIEYSNRESAVLSINYQGDVDAPLTIRFAGPVVNPWIENITTGERIEIIKAIAAGETLEIASGYRQKRIEIINIAGTRTNAFHYISAGSSFIHLQKGFNEMEFGSNAGLNSASVELQHDTLYAAI